MTITHLIIVAQNKVNQPKLVVTVSEMKNQKLPQFFEVSVGDAKMPISVTKAQKITQYVYQ